MSGQIIHILQQQIDRLIAEKDELKKELNSERAISQSLREDVDRWKTAFHEVKAAGDRLAAAVENRMRMSRFR